VLPVALLAFGALVGQERLDVRRLLALALGSGRLMLLFAGSLSVRGSVLEAWAASAILLSALLYAVLMGEQMGVLDSWARPPCSWQPGPRCGRP
jgi:drug/metabolite transporter (DMT)-like permease